MGGFGWADDRCTEPACDCCHTSYCSYSAKSATSPAFSIQMNTLFFFFGRSQRVILVSMNPGFTLALLRSTWDPPPDNNFYLVCTKRVLLFWDVIDFTPSTRRSLGRMCRPVCPVVWAYLLLVPFPLFLFIFSFSLPSFFLILPRVVVFIVFTLK